MKEVRRCMSCKWVIKTKIKYELIRIENQYEQEIE